MGPRSSLPELGFLHLISAYLVPSPQKPFCSSLKPGILSLPCLESLVVCVKGGQWPCDPFIVLHLWLQE